MLPAQWAANPKIRRPLLGFIPAIFRVSGLLALDPCDRIEFKSERTVLHIAFIGAHRHTAIEV